VVLERHLATVCDNHKVSVAKKNPTIADFNEALKAATVIDLPQWRFIQHLADLRNMCDHARTPDPTSEQIGDLVAGVKKITKTVF
jgi:phage tail protein X